MILYTENTKRKLLGLIKIRSVFSHIGQSPVIRQKRYFLGIRYRSKVIFKARFASSLTAHHATFEAMHR